MTATNGTNGTTGTTTGTTTGAMNGAQAKTSARLFDATSASLPEFQKICARTADPASYPLASAIEHNVPIYETSHFDPWDAAATSALQDEWYAILASGPGVFVLKDMYDRRRYEPTLAAANAAFQRIIDHERTSQTPKGDHFAASGKNDRIWNSFSKHAVDDPASFLDYYANPWLAVASEAWLGPGYRVTAQCNIVKPGGKAQDSHRDYHLGFQDLEASARFPRGLHLASQLLTLQGAVAHSDMPVESGPTRYLPFSQTYDIGYLAWRRDDFRAFFQANYVALPLKLGDGVFFNPGLFHAAGANDLAAESGFHRKANLLQVSSAFGKPMETVDTVPVVQRCWEGLARRFADAGGGVVNRELRMLVQAVAEAYPFPTNLDKRPPAPSGMAPESEQEILVHGLEAGWTVDEVVGELEKMQRDSRA